MTPKQIKNRFKHVTLFNLHYLQVAEAEILADFCNKLLYKTELTPHELAKHANNLLKSYKSEFHIYASATEPILQAEIKNLPF